MSQITVLGVAIGLAVTPIFVPLWMGASVVRACGVDVPFLDEFDKARKYKQMEIEREKKEQENEKEREQKEMDQLYINELKNLSHQIEENLEHFATKLSDNNYNTDDIFFIKERDSFYSSLLAENIQKNNPTNESSVTYHNNTFNEKDKHTNNLHHGQAQADMHGEDIREDINKKIQNLYTKLKIINSSNNSEYAELIKEASDNCSNARLRIIYDSLRFSFGNKLRNYSKNIWHKKKISEMSNLLEGEIRKKYIDEFSYLLNSDYQISEGEFANAVNKYISYIKIMAREKQNAILEEQTVQQLNQLGYKVIKEKQSNADGVIYFNTPDSDYKIMARVNPENSQLSLRFIRVVASEKEKLAYTTSQRRKDKEKARQWCDKSKKIAEMIADKTGIHLQEIYRKEPEDQGEILVIVNPSLVNDNAKTKVAATRTNNATL